MDIIEIEIRGLKDTVDYLQRGSQRVLLTVPVVVRFGQEILQTVRNYSPVETGEYKSSWSSRVVYVGSYLVEVHIENDAPHAGPVSYGSLIGKPPWLSVGPKTTLFGKRITSKQAPLGVVEPVLNEFRIRSICNQIADKVVGK